MGNNMKLRITKFIKPKKFWQILSDYTRLTFLPQNDLQVTAVFGCPFYIHPPCITLSSTANSCCIIFNIQQTPPISALAHGRIEANNFHH
jgi:hypothetical protein